VLQDTASLKLIMAAEVPESKVGDASDKNYFEIVRNKNLHVSVVPRYHPWLESRFHFRFASWHPSPKRFGKKHGFGRLHVLNDDIVQPDNGFGTHSHQNQEIFSYVLNGELSHKHADDSGKSHSEALPRGSVQYMSAGSWVEHSELNESSTKICRFLQTWIYPNKKNLPVQYGSQTIPLEDRKNKLYQMICGLKSEGQASIQLMQDVNVYVSEMDEDAEITYELGKDRQAYLVCPEGSVSVNNGDFELNTREASRLYGPVSLTIKATGKDGTVDERTGEKMPSAHIMMIEMAQEDAYDNAKEPDANGKDGAMFMF